MSDRIIDGLPYPIVIADDAARSVGALSSWGVTRAALVYDRRVEARANAIGSALAGSGVDVRAAIGLGCNRSTKSIATVSKLYDALLSAGADRSTLVVAVGGGTLSDVAGYAAATFMRGLPWMVVPTTVLGMADAAIGGKTGIDLRQGKNLAGVFWQPVAVIGDLEALRSLPLAHRSTGVAEIVKCGVIAGAELLDRVDRVRLRAASSAWKDAIAAAAQVKASIVARDPHERGERAVLNLGHTVGHALEAATGYRMAHGRAVSIGLRAAGLIARSATSWSAGDHGRMLASLSRAGLPLHAEGIAADDVVRCMARDKKSVDGRVRFVLPERIGSVRFGVDVGSDLARQAVEACMMPPPAAELSS